MRAKSELVQHLIKQYAGMITGKRPAGAVCAMHTGRKSNNQKASCTITERRYGAAIVVRVFILHPVEERRQARTKPAVSIEDISHPCAG